MKYYRKATIEDFEKENWNYIPEEIQVIIRENKDENSVPLAIQTYISMGMDGKTATTEVYDYSRSYRAYLDFLDGKEIFTNYI
jgi:hypothetical protein